jgi:DNA invertase Pin-like site-specific DNA recombinase
MLEAYQKKFALVVF